MPLRTMQRIVKLCAASAHHWPNLVFDLADGTVTTTVVSSLQFVRAVLNAE
jgi:hypothetical protein